MKQLYNSKRILAFVLTFIMIVSNIKLFPVFATGEDGTNETVLYSENFEDETVTAGTEIGTQYNPLFPKGTKANVVAQIRNATGTEGANEEQLSVEKTVDVGTKTITFSITVKYTVGEMTEDDGNTKTNGYLKVTEGESSGSQFGPKFDVTTSDTLVMDVALRVEDNLNDVKLYSKPNGSTATLFTIKEGKINGTAEPLAFSTTDWTQIRMVWDLDAAENNLMIYAKTDGSYVLKHTKTVSSATKAPDHIRFQTSTHSDTNTPAESLHIDNFYVYTTKDTDYTVETLNKVTSIYEQNYDGECIHTSDACPAKANSNLQYKAPVSHESE